MFLIQIDASSFAKFENIRVRDIEIRLYWFFKGLKITTNVEVDIMGFHFSYWLLNYKYKFKRSSPFNIIRNICNVKIKCSKADLFDKPVFDPGIATVSNRYTRWKWLGKAMAIAKRIYLYLPRVPVKSRIFILNAYFFTKFYVLTLVRIVSSRRL